ncbi:MAG TPA: peptidoglycan bridge formation glycyltransferase FemA/FemB family protein [Patescibacteria group bacterium]|nr:peptidoglycan bridge formation glycyltransferase FemA/FemB family protein [Patescibacteria group bacterium]
MHAAYKHFLQSPEWAKVNRHSGWQPFEFAHDISAFIKRTPLGNVVYIPGFAPKTQEELEKLTSVVRGLRKNIVLVKVDPCVPEDTETTQWFSKSGWSPARSAQYAFTVQLDLTKPQETLLKELKSRARYEVNFALRSNVVVEEVEPTDREIERMFELLSETSKRKDFTIRDKAVTIGTWQAFRDSNKLKLFFAKHDKKIISAAVVLTDGKNFAWYKEGASNPTMSKFFGTRLLLFEAAKTLKKEGYKVFDLGGVPDPATYEQSHMRGIFIFKTGFNREIMEMMPAYELPLNKTLYRLWPKLELAYLKQARLRNKRWY